MVLQAGKFGLDRFIRAARDGGPFKEHPADPASEGTNAPTFNTAHLRIEVALDRILQIKDFLEVTPAKAFRKLKDAAFFWPESREAHHVEQILPAETKAELVRQLSRQCRDNLLAVAGSLATEHLLRETRSNPPVEKHQFAIDKTSRTSTRALNQLSQFTQKKCVTRPDDFHLAIFQRRGAFGGSSHRFRLFSVR